MMRDMLETAVSVNGAALPIPVLDFAGGLYVSASASAASSVNLPSRTAYQITATSPVLLRQGGVAAKAAGSTYLAAGVPMHLLLDAGALSVVAATETAADVYVVPLK